MDTKYEFSEGDDVRIATGAFASFVGKVITVDNASQRVTVMGRFEAQPASDLHTLNVGFSVVVKSSVATQRIETILVVEDDETLRNLIHELLSRDGYRVLPAANGDAALSVCKEHEQPIHLLLADVTWPGMDGRKVADALVQLYPEMKVLFMSGYTEAVISHYGVLEGNIPFIQKPFAPEVLASKVREVLGNPVPPPAQIE